MDFRRIAATSVEEKGRAAALSLLATVSSLRATVLSWRATASPWRATTLS
jgi:hypothetical protein